MQKLTLRAPRGATQRCEVVALKRWHVGRLDRVDHLFGAAQRCEVVALKRWHVGRLDRVDHLFGAAQRCEVVAKPSFVEFLQVREHLSINSDSPIAFPCVFTATSGSPLLLALSLPLGV